MGGGDPRLLQPRVSLAGAVGTTRPSLSPDTLQVGWNKISTPLIVHKNSRKHLGSLQLTIILLGARLNGYGEAVEGSSKKCKLVSSNLCVTTNLTKT